MKPYWRAESRRFEEREAVSGWFARAGAPAIEPEPAAPTSFDGEDTLVVSRPQFDADFFSFAFERALGPGDDALATIARCEAWRITRGFRCGAERAATDGWCGSPLCGPCAEARADEAGRLARVRWPETVFVVDVPIGVAGKQTLPTAEEVVTARDGWARAAKAAAGEVGRVEGLPRAAVTPDGLVLFVQPPVGMDGSRADDVARALEQAAQTTGHSFTVVRAATREQAAQALQAAMTLEARRFREGVAFDPQGAPRWVEQARARHADLRRPTLLGGREALPAPGARGPSTGPAECPSHGATLCAGTATLVRDAAGRVLHSAGPLPAKPTRQAFMGLAVEAARAAGRARAAA